MDGWWKDGEMTRYRRFSISSRWLDRGLKPVYEGAPYKFGFDGWMNDERMMRWLEIDDSLHYLVS